jgi:hypothetical protein
MVASKVAIGQYHVTESGDPQSTIITSNNWPRLIDEAGLRGEWFEVALIPIRLHGSDWSLLQATQDSLREHAAEAKQLRGLLNKLDEVRRNVRLIEQPSDMSVTITLSSCRMAGMLRQLLEASHE